jgi:hypothetical protein
MTPEQGTLDGAWVPYPPPRPWHATDRQRALLRFMRHDPAPIRTVQARHFYADASGALRRLEAMGLVERVGRGKWRAT